MTAFFGRLVSVSVGSHKFQGFRIALKVRQSLSSKSNTAEVTISNLNEKSRGDLTSLKDPGFLIEAGYESSMGSVFLGTAEKISHKRTSPGFETVISASDGSKEGRRVINVALAPGSKVEAALEHIAKAMKVSAKRAIKDIKSGKFNRNLSKFLNGYTLFGNTKTVLDKLTHALGVRWDILDGELRLFGAEDTSKEDAVVLSESSGLIGSPELFVDPKHPKKLLYKARSLMQPILKPGRRVLFASTEIRGSFRVEIAEHNGDNYGGDWFTDITVKEVKP